jgi:hypothetical protein
MVLAGVLLLVAAGLLHVRSNIRMMDARLGADILVQAPGMITTHPEPLIMPSAQPRTVATSTVAAIARLPGVTTTMALYNLGETLSPGVSGLSVWVQPAVRGH